MVTTTTIPITREEIPAEPTPPALPTQPTEEPEPGVEDEPVVEEAQGVEEPEPVDDLQPETCETEPGTVDKTIKKVVKEIFTSHLTCLRSQS